MNREVRKHGLAYRQAVVVDGKRQTDRSAEGSHIADATVLPDYRMQIGDPENAEIEAGLRPTYEPVPVIDSNGNAIGSPKCTQVVHAAIPEKAMAFLTEIKRESWIRDGGVGKPAYMRQDINAVSLTAVATEAP